MTLCIDTNAYSKLLRSHDSALKATIENADQVLVPAIVIGELCASFNLGTRQSKNETILDDFLSLPGVEIVDVDRDVAERYGTLIKILRQQGTPIPTNDIWIAAIALETGARLVSYDKHFEKIPGLLVLAP